MLDGIAKYLILSTNVNQSHIFHSSKHHNRLYHDNNIAKTYKHHVLAKQTHFTEQ